MNVDPTTKTTGQPHKLDVGLADLLSQEMLAFITEATPIDTTRSSEPSSVPMPEEIVTIALGVGTICRPHAWD